MEFTVEEVTICRVAFFFKRSTPPNRFLRDLRNIRQANSSPLLCWGPKFNFHHLRKCKRESIIVVLTLKSGVRVKFYFYTSCGTSNGFMKAIKSGYHKQRHIQGFVKHLRRSLWRKYLFT